MKVLVLGVNGMLGPHALQVLSGRYDLRLADIADPHGVFHHTTGFVADQDQKKHEFMTVDVSDPDQVMDAAAGMDAIVNVSVLRDDRQISFDVNVRGSYNIMAAAVRHGIRRVISSGAHFTVQGHDYERFDFDIHPDVPSHPGLGMYPFTKSLGLELSRVFTENHDIHLMWFLFYNFFDPEDLMEEYAPFSVTWSDAAEAIRCALEVDLTTLPSRCEAFNIFTDMPHRKFSNEKTRRLLNWKPQHTLEHFWRKPR
jgi:uronate dehydrogenase